MFIKLTRMGNKQPVLFNLGSVWFENHKADSNHEEDFTTVHTVDGEITVQEPFNMIMTALEPIEVV